MPRIQQPTSCKVKTQKQGETLEVSRGNEAKEQVYVLVSRKSLGADVAENGTCTPTLTDETEVEAKEG